MRRSRERSGKTGTIAAAWALLLGAAAPASAGTAWQPEDTLDPPGVAPGFVPGIAAATADAEDQPEQGGDTGLTDEADLTVEADLDESFEIGPFAEPIDINTFVDLVAEALEINVTKDASLAGQIAFNSTMTITKRELLPLLDLRLEELGFTIVPDPLGFYTIRRADQVVVNPGDAADSTTRFIATPGLRPTALSGLIGTQLTLSRVSYEDELGVIVVTDTPRRIAQLESLVEALIEQRQRMITESIPLRFISAPVALERAIERLGGSGPVGGLGLTPAQQAQQQGGQPAIGGRSGLNNLSQRLTPDPAGNALIFLGLPEELEGVREIIAAVDRRNGLVSQKYFTGSATRVIADLAERQGFGRVIEASQQTNQQGNFFNVNRFQEQVNNQLGQQTSGEDVSGSQLLVDQNEGTVTFFGTPEQQTSFAELIEGFDTQDEVIVVEPYKLQYSDAADVADILQALITRSSPQGDDSPFLPQNQAANVARQFQQAFNPDAAPQLEENQTSILGDDSFVFADESNNQVLVTAPRSQQDAFEKLIRQIDLRRAQVYIEATVIAVTDTDDFRLAIEGAFTDLDGSGNGGGVQTNFGLSGAGASFTDPRVVATGLGGITASIIRSEFVPVIINATKTDTTSRVVATPQLLVDDNANSQVLTSQEVPFQTTSQNDAATLTSFDFATAQTSLDVTPQISVGGTVRLEYQINLESFTGPSVNGAPPPRQTNEISGDSVTVPNGGTVVIGGIGLRNDSETIIKVPLLGDIPVLGNLFRDTNRDLSDVVLYVFLTPRVLRNPTLEDYRLISLGPFAEVDLPDYIPELEAVMIRSSLPGVPGDSGDDRRTPPGLVLPSDRDPSRNQQELRPREESR
ncbi:MAG: secretin N-terminal domain-containing protein [Planctomycetota bacterium]